MRVNIPDFDPDFRQELCYQCFHAMRREYPDLEEELGADAISFFKRMSEVVSFFLVATLGLQDMDDAWAITEALYPAYITSLDEDGEFIMFVAAMIAAENHPLFAEYYCRAS